MYYWKCFVCSLHYSQHFPRTFAKNGMQVIFQNRNGKVTNTNNETLCATGLQTGTLYTLDTARPCTIFREVACVANLKTWHRCIMRFTIKNYKWFVKMLLIGYRYLETSIPSNHLCHAYWGNWRELLFWNPQKNALLQLSKLFAVSDANCQEMVITKY